MVPVSHGVEPLPRPSARAPGPACGHHHRACARIGHATIAGTRTLNRLASATSDYGYSTGSKAVLRSIGNTQPTGDGLGLALLVHKALDRPQHVRAGGQDLQFLGLGPIEVPGPVLKCPLQFVPGGAEALTYRRAFETWQLYVRLLST